MIGYIYIWIHGFVDGRIPTDASWPGASCGALVDFWSRRCEKCHLDGDEWWCPWPICLKYETDVISSTYIIYILYIYLYMNMLLQHTVIYIDIGVYSYNPYYIVHIANEAWGNWQSDGNSLQSLQPRIWAKFVEILEESKHKDWHLCVFRARRGVGTAQWVGKRATMTWWWFVERWSTWKWRRL